MLLGYSVKRFFVDNAGTLEKLTLLHESWYFCKFQLRYDEREKERKKGAKKERMSYINIYYLLFILYDFIYSLLILSDQKRGVENG